MAKDTRERILAAALEMFSQNGFAGTNIREVPGIIDAVVNAGVNVYAFARYCPTAADASDGIVGTRDGVFLPGFALEGRYFIDADKLDTFFDSCAKRTSEDAAKKTAGRRSTKARANAALAALRKNYGF